MPRTYSTARSGGPLNRGALLRHLQGEITLAVYPGREVTKWMCIDVDSHDPGLIHDVIIAMGKVGIKPVIENSGNKGFHFWVFFRKPIANWKARKIGRAISEKHEVFPKQDRVVFGKLGAPIKLPLGGHLATNVRCRFVDRHLNAYPDQLGHLHTVVKHDGEMLWKRMGFEKQDHVEAEEHQDGPSTVKPCVKRIIREGVPAGSRNQAGYIIACECRRAGLPKSETRGVLRSWNLRDQPPLALEEIRAIVRSSYEKDYTYGCASDGPLRSLVRCENPEECPYFRHFLHNHDPPGPGGR